MGAHGLIGLWGLAGIMAAALPEDDAVGHEFEVPVLLSDALPVPSAAAKQRHVHSLSSASLSSETVSLLDSNKGNARSSDESYCPCKYETKAQSTVLSLEMHGGV